MMVSEEKRVPTNTHVLIVHGQGRQRRGQVGLGFPWHGMEDSLGRGLYPHSAISQWPPTAWNFSHDHEQGDLVSIVHLLAARGPAQQRRRKEWETESCWPSAPCGRIGDEYGRCALAKND